MHVPSLVRIISSREREAAISTKQTIMAAMAALLALTMACGAAGEEASQPTPAPGRAALTDKGGTGSETERMIVRVVNMSLVVHAPIETLDAVTQMTQEMDGFIVSTRRSGGERDLVVTISLRVPTERTDEAIQRLRGLAERVTSEEVRAQDVTEEYVDLQAQLRNLEATEGQLLTLMQRAETVSDTLEIQSELSRVSGEIERLKGRLQYLERTSATSLFNLTLVSSVSAEPLVEPGWQPLEIAKDGIRGLVSVGQGLANLGIYLGIFSPLWVPAAAIVWYLLRRQRRQRRTSDTFAVAGHQPPAPPGTVVCPNCHQEMPLDTRFCTNCGENLESK